MSNIKNSVMLIGHLGGDPEVRETKTGKVISRASLATNSTYKNKSGEKTTDTQWHRLVAWEGAAEYMNKYLRKGSHVAVLGRIEYVSFEASDGSSRNYAEIIVDEFMNFDRPTGDQGEPF